MSKAKKTEKRFVIVCTEHRGVFAGRLESYDPDRRVAVLTEARMAIRWGTKLGLFELASLGPSATGLTSACVPRIALEKCTATIDTTAEAEAAWLAAK